FFILIIISVILIITYYFLTINRKQLKRLRKEWDEGTFIPSREHTNSVSSYWKNKRKHTESYIGVDLLTWHDLSMQEVFEKLNYTKSSLGSEYLFNQLHDIDPELTYVSQKE